MIMSPDLWCSFKSLSGDGGDLGKDGGGCDSDEADDGCVDDAGDCGNGQMPAQQKHIVVTNHLIQWS